jgi:hypothetical protein
MLLSHKVLLAYPHPSPLPKRERRRMEGDEEIDYMKVLHLSLYLAV